MRATVLVNHDGHSWYPVFHVGGSGVRFEGLSFDAVEFSIPFDDRRFVNWSLHWSGGTDVDNYIFDRSGGGGW